MPVPPQQPGRPAGNPPGRPAAPAAGPQPTKPGQIPQDPRQRYEIIMRGFRGPLPDYKTSPFYFVGLFVTSLVMMFLPLVYLGLIALVGYMSYWHLIANFSYIQYAPGSRLKLIALFIYITPSIIGVIVTLFMIKPLFSWSGSKNVPRSLNRHEEPLLFALVDHICDLVGSPKPRRIDVDCDINASASFRSGMLSLLHPSDMVLTIGMPLVAGLTLKQLAGVLAHEFGHFSQGAGMRLTFVIRTINFWFLRVAYERDAWDEWLSNMASGSKLGFVFGIAQFCIYLTRKLLWLLMMLGNIVAGFMLRQMEYDADSFEARLVGSQTFAETARRLAVLNVAHSGAMSDLQSFQREGRLVDNLPRLIYANVSQIPKRVLLEVQKQIDKARTGLTDSHPSDCDRIAAAGQFPPHGVFDCNFPAAAVFTSFNHTATMVTIDLYRRVFDKDFKPASVHPVEMLLNRQEREKQAYEAFGRFMGGEEQTFRFLTAKCPPAKQKNLNALRRIIDEARTVMKPIAGQYQASFKYFDECDELLVELRQCESLLQLGIRPQGEFRRTYGSLQECYQGRAELEQHRASVEETLGKFERYAEARMGAALLLLFQSDLSTKIANVKTKQADAQRLLGLIRKCCAVRNDVLEIRDIRAIVGAMIGHAQDNADNESLMNHVKSRLGNVRYRIESLWASFADIPYPFDHAQQGITIQYAWAKEIPPFHEVGALMEVGGDVMVGVMSLYGRSISRLCEYVEEVERCLGMEPLAQTPAKT